MRSGERLGEHARNNLPGRIPWVRSNDDGEALGEDIFLLAQSIRMCYLSFFGDKPWFVRYQGGICSIQQSPFSKL
jgi:hypothetical protein